MPSTRSGLPFGVAVTLGLAVASSSGGAQAGGPEPPTPRVTVAFELVVEDARGRPVTDLRLEELEVVQDATRQRVRMFRAGSEPGHYDVSYGPLSGRAGGVTVRVTRPGTRVRGPDGPSLKPRVISPLSPLETELTAVLESRPGAGDLTCHVALLRFEPTARGVRHAVTVEIPLAELRFEHGPAGGRARLQVLARIRSVDDPTVSQNVTLDQVVEAATDAAISVQRLVWTGTVLIGPGRHTIEILVRDPGSGRATTSTLSAEVPPPSERLHLSSVVLLRPRSFFFLRDQAEGDDPLVYQGLPLMPALQPNLQAGEESYARFYVALYPAAGGGEPVSLTAQVLRDGAMVGEASIALPKPEPSGEIRYVGLLVTRSLRAGSYVLRLIGRQGAETAADEAPFVLSVGGAAMRLPARQP